MAAGEGAEDGGGLPGPNLDRHSDLSRPTAALPAVEARTGGS